MAVIAHSSVEGFFHEVVSEALDRQSLQASEHAAFYLVALLGEFTRQRISDEPLSMKLALASEPGERVATLKEVGDTTLWLSGFFGESLGRRLVNPDFYIGLGEAAYSELAQRLSVASGATQVYRELAGNFPSFVEVLAYVSRQVNLSGASVGQLFETWLDTRAEWVERRLRTMGVAIDGDSGGGTVH